MTSLRDRIFQKYRELNKPHSALLELTHRCICRCVHCYLEAGQTVDELTLDEIGSLFKALREQGVINMGFTGGEPFLRHDLPDILALARENQFFIAMLTTAITITEAEVELLKNNNVWNLEISLLGDNAKTHDGIMRCPGAFEKTMRAIKLLVKAGINVTLKATIMKNNYRELAGMHGIAHELRLPLSASINIAPKTNGDRSTQLLGLTAKELERMELKYIQGGFLPDETFKGGALLTCNAGRTVIGISPSGDVYPCLLLRRSLGNIRSQPLNDILQGQRDSFLGQLRALSDAEVAECYRCELRPHCQRCPGIAFLETGEIARSSPSACSLARFIQMKKKRID